MIRRSSKRANQRGFALLLVMLMAAAVAFSLYVQLPRVGFESMRDKEQLLMDRGNQYKRAIQVYYADNKRYPARLEDLENTNDKRYLRRRYKDPLTGKDEWRIIHSNGSYLTDSLVQKPPAQTAQNGTPGQGILPGSGPLGTNNMNSQPGQANAPGQGNAPGQANAPGSGLGLFGNTPAANNAANNNNGTNGTGTNIDPNTGLPIPTPMNPFAQRRPSDRLIPGDGTTAQTANPQQDNGTAPVYPPGYNPSTFNPNDPSTWPPITIQTPTAGQTGQPGQPVQNGQPGQLQPAGGQNTLAGQQPGTQVTPLPFDQNQQQQQPSNQQPIPGQVQPTPLPFGTQPIANNDGAVGQTNPPLVNSGIPGQSPGLGGANPQPVTNGLPFNGNPFAPNTNQQPGGVPSQNPFANQQSGTQPGAQAGQQNPTALNPALQAINSQLSNPTGALGGNPNTQTAPGIAGVASTYEGVGIKIYNKRSKYKEWEFVYDPSTNTPTGSTTPGQNPLGQPAQSSGTPSGASPFGQTPNPFAPSTGQTPNSSPMPSSSTPSTNPFAPNPSPFGTPGQ